tara:strand:- start:29437 stop:30273 length:837 start_codon:yes stop_codon:yes gene_type:complete
MSKTPFMPLWVSDFLGDTLDLDATEIGAYMLLLMAQWNRDGESLPDDVKKLQRVARCGRSWTKVWGNIGRFFTTDENGIYSKRLRLEAQNVAAKRQVNAHNGALGGSAKALKTKEPDVANATNSLQRNASIPEPEPYIIKKEDTNVSCAITPPAIDEIAQAVTAYNEAAERIGWPKVQKLSPARRTALNNRLKDAGGPEGWKAALEKAQASSFLTGQTSKPFLANFDFITKAGNFTKIMEGNYDDRTNNNGMGEDRTPGGNGKGGNSFLDEIAAAARS